MHLGIKIGDTFVANRSIKIYGGYPITKGHTYEVYRIDSGNDVWLNVNDDYQDEYAKTAPAVRSGLPSRVPGIPQPEEHRTCDKQPRKKRPPIERFHKLVKNSYLPVRKKVDTPEQQYN